MKIFAPLFRYDYGDPEHGESLEKVVFVPALSVSAEVYPFWLEEHGYPNDINGLQQAILAEAGTFNPDLIFFILMRDEVRPATISTLSKRWHTANWFCDDQWRFDTFTRFIAPLLTYPITVDKYSLPNYHAIGCKKVILSQWASSYLPMTERFSKFEYDVSFVGGRNSVREWYIRELKKKGIKVSCFGEGWPAGRVSYDKMKTIMQQSKICLNLSNSQPRDRSYFSYIWRRFAFAVLGINADIDGYSNSLRCALNNLYNLYRSEKRVEQIKARNFEIPAWGGFQLSQFAIGIDDYFVPGREIAIFSNIEELVKLIHYYLSNADERESMRLAGNRRAAHYTYENRINDIVEWIGNDQNILKDNELDQG
ncbi:MAG: glycosyltransferase [Nitrospirota bacterium]|nr:glycosyltransferase [Nitrospirota bacterium]